MTWATREKPPEWASPAGRDRLVGARQNRQSAGRCDRLETGKSYSQQDKIATAAILDVLKDQSDVAQPQRFGRAIFRHRVPQRQWSILPQKTKKSHLLPDELRDPSGEKGLFYSKSPRYLHFGASMHRAPDYSHRPELHESGYQRRPPEAQTFGYAKRDHQAQAR